MPASLHIGDGVARIGGVTLPARASARGLELGGDAFLQPLPFGLRSRLVIWSGGGLGEAVLEESLKGTVEGVESLALQALALHLAGAGSGAPGFASSAALVARLLGWPFADINAAEAQEIDRLSASLAPAMEQGGDDGWTTVLFSGGTGESDDGEPLDAICARLSADLQRRGSEAVSSAEAAILSAAPPAHRQQSDWRKASAFGVEGFGAASTHTAGPAPDVGAATRPAGTPNAKPPPASPSHPWRGASAAPGGFASPPFFSAPTPGRSAPAAPPQRLGSNVWAVPQVGGNPAPASQLTPGGPPAQPDGLQGATGASARAPGTGHAAWTGAASTQPSAMPAGTGSPAAGHSGTQAVAHPAPPQGQVHAPAVPAAPPLAAPTGAFAREDAPTRASLFWDAVATPAHQVAGLPSPSGGTAAMPANDPAVRTQTPALDLDAIADALHAIADLRGVAR